MTQNLVAMQREPWNPTSTTISSNTVENSGDWNSFYIATEASGVVADVFANVAQRYGQPFIPKFRFLTPLLLPAMAFAPASGSACTFGTRIAVASATARFLYSPDAFHRPYYGSAGVAQASDPADATYTGCGGATLYGYVFNSGARDASAQRAIQATSSGEFAKRERALAVMRSWLEPHESDDQAAAFRQLKEDLNEARRGQRRLFPD